MRIEQIALEVVKIFISSNMSGLLVHYNEAMAVRTVNNNDGDAIIFAITQSTIDVVHYNKDTKKASNIAIINSHDPDVPGELLEVIEIIKEDYVDSDCNWLDLPNGYESFTPSDWWKYGGSPAE